MKMSIFRTATALGLLSVFLMVGLSTRISYGAGSGEKPDLPRTDGRSGSTPISRESDFVPSYVELHKSGELARRAGELWQMMESCTLCPRSCGVNRLAGERGYCRAPGYRLILAAIQPHFGEERPLVGRGGSGTLFFSHCNLRCVFCQNYQISIQGRGTAVSINDLAAAMLSLQELGSHNINVVTPTHYSPHIVAALDIAAGQGLRIPLVWNTSGWERVEVLRLLDGVVDIYLPDIKFAASAEAGEYTATPSYPEDTRAAVLEMHRQVGVARPDSGGIINRGLMIRHLVMPDSASGSREVLDWIAENLPSDTYINIMEQYSPHHQAFNFPRIARRIDPGEYQAVVDHARDLGLTNLDSRTARWLD
ncbi:putative pyruvate formate lyase activating enzyme [Alkalispirochaeta americana]|uniref:Putative pyruvate formate lyase activating enzyme n=1 Tax=Alkalispirochaeta americana TaxID=159291 RepID=A0A1N6VXL3_9SPIO|nr:radical SAM protein [Alkalispirochaeta americana]SIQ82619.1 putative pyruvate formate lyase activating enzyme [Alkalispirochaeta americana]